MGFNLLHMNGSFRRASPHREEHALCHSPSVISLLLYMEVEAEQYEEMSLFSICSLAQLERQ